MQALLVLMISTVMFLLVAVGAFVLPGRCLVGAQGKAKSVHLIVLSLVAGLGITVTAYAASRQLDVMGAFWIAWLALAAGGLFQLRRWWMECDSRRAACDPLVRAATLAGATTMVLVGSAFWLSGWPGNDGIAFFGPMSRDHIYHLALIERLTVRVPPDNFIVAGPEFPAYHFLPDLVHVLIRQMTLGQISSLDLYFRLYPSAILFCLGYLGFWVSARLTGYLVGGWLGVVMVVLGPDLSWLLGLAQVLANLGDPAAAVQRLFDPWCSWNSFGTTLPLVHRPAFYHGMLFFLAGIAFLLTERMTPRGWALSGALWGLSAGFNYTFAAVLGVAVALAAVGKALRTGSVPLRSLVASGLCMVIGSLVANLTVLGGQKVSSEGGVLAWAPGAFAAERWGHWFPERLGNTAVAALSIAMLVLISYGPRLVGLKHLLRARLRFATHEDVALVMALATILSAALGLLFAFQGVGGLNNNIILLQPTGWLMGMFAVVPLARWFRRRTRLWRGVALVLLVPGIFQSLLAFNLSYKVTIREQELRLYEFVKSAAHADDIIAFLPASRDGSPVLGRPGTLNNFFVPALTGLRGYYSSEGYSIHYLSGEFSRSKYEQRVRAITVVQSGEYGLSDLKALMDSGVRWIVVPGTRDRHPASVTVSEGGGMVLLDLSRLPGQGSDAAT